MVARVVVGAAVSTCLLSITAALTLGGGVTAIVAATALVTYMVASAILLVRGEERWLGLMLLPGMVASPILLALPKGSVLSETAAVVFIGGSFLAVVYRAFRNAGTSTGGGRTSLSRHDLFVASGHLLHGVLCGLAISVVVIQTGRTSPDGSFARLLLPVPMLATLGVMEWQLHTFRARMAIHIHALVSCGRFPSVARRELLRSLTVCVVSNATVALAVLIVVRIHGGSFAAGSMAIQCALGAAFFTDLIIVMFDRLDLVLRSWLIGFTLGLLSLGAVLLVENDTALAIHWAAFTLVSVVLVLLLVHVRTVVSVAMNH